mgnify:CR=1 FL=1
MKYNKLVRDKIPEIIKKNGGVAVIQIAGEAEYYEKLKEKLSEEIEEFKKDENMEELADIFEVMEAILDYKGFDLTKIREIQKKKVAERGGFKKRIILDES